MGFMDKLKSLKNAVTGGAATVSVEIPDIRRDEPFTVKVTANIDSAELKINKVYIKLRCDENVQVPDVDVAADQDGEMQVRQEIVTASVDIIFMEIEVSGAETLEANQEYTWEAEISLPDDAPATYRGTNAHIIYVLEAGLDAFGNDPDSGEIEFEVF